MENTQVEVRDVGAIRVTDPTFTHEELVSLTGFVQPSRQLAELHRRGFSRAYRNRLGRVILERAHYDAVCAGQAQPARPKVRMIARAA